MEVFQHLTDEEAYSLFLKFREQGFNEDDAWNEVYSIDCNMDEEEF